MSTTTTAPRTTSREEIAANVRAEMARKRVDQRTIGAALGKAGASVSGRIHGEIHFRVHELQTIAAVLEVSLEQLLQPPIDRSACIQAGRHLYDIPGQPGNGTHSADYCLPELAAAARAASD